MSDRVEEFHIPVLLKQLVKSLNVQPFDIVLDGTVGSGGHANEICKTLGRDGIYIALDLDRGSLLRSKENIVRRNGNEIFFIEGNFKNTEKVLEATKLKKVNKIILDLGWNYDQAMKSGRGFSFNKDEPLLMTYGISEQNYLFTAKNIVNEWEEKNIGDILYNYADETNSRKIAKAIVEYRKIKTIESSKELAEIVEKIIPRTGKLHPATKTFQGIRIAVNDEIRSLKQGLPKLWDILEKDGKMAIITFHSIEDKVVKTFFKERENLKKGTRDNKKVIKPSFDEIKINERARSAKLRVITKN